MILAAICGVVAIWPLFKGGGPALSWLAAAVLLLATALLLPRMLNPLLKLWLKIGHVIGLINTKLILVLVYVIIVTPIGIFMKIFGHDPMGFRSSKAVSSWKPRDETWSQESYRRQF